MREGLSRRGFVLLGGGLLLSGCSATSTSTRTSRPNPSTAVSAPPSTSGGSSSTFSRPRLPTVTRWHPSGNDVTPAAKLAAVREIEARGNLPGTALEVIDAQYGGILTNTASVLVVCRSWRSTSLGIEEAGSTYDVRLSRPSDGWHVTAVHQSRPGAPSTHHSPEAREVLASPRIGLPPAARKDVLSGQVHDTVLAAMLQLSRSYRIGVSVVRSGHPIYVFGTDRLSDHPAGRAFDTWLVDGEMVIDPGTPRRLITGYMEAAAAAGSDNVGGPYLLGTAPQYFSDATHHDHVHAGFET